MNDVSKIEEISSRIKENVSNKVLGMEIYVKLRRHDVNVRQRDRYKYFICCDIKIGERFT